MKNKVYHNERSNKTFLSLGFRSYAALGIRMKHHHVDGKEPLDQMDFFPKLFFVMFCLCD